jgi:hypothetical protein
LALALQVSVRNGGHKVQVGKWLGEQNISPDNIENHMQKGGPQYINTLDQIMAIIGISAKHMKQNPKTRPHWGEMLTQPNGKKWVGKMKRALQSIRVQAIQDIARKQMRCEPKTGLYKLICATNTGHLREKTQSMTWIYTAILRANMERWQVQDHIMKRAYHGRGLVTTLNTAKIYARSHTRVPAGYAV